MESKVWLKPEEEFEEAMEASAETIEIHIPLETVDTGYIEVVAYCACGAKELENPESPECCT